MKIGIIGGSIAGLASAILLSKQGAQVTLFERSKENLEGRGAGIILSEAVIQQCIDLDLFDSNIPRIEASARSFVTQNGHKLWEQPLIMKGLNWSDIYSHLSERFPEANIKRGEKVLSIEPESQGYKVCAESGSTYHFDYVIGADGINSCVRETLFPEVKPQYCGYVAWRGTVPLSQVMSAEVFKNHIPYFVYPNGHLLLYVIPAKDYAQSGELLLNWVMYDTCKTWTIDALLTDAQGKRHANSLPPGSLSQNHELYLKTFAHQVLPGSIADIICQTKEPFLQVVYDCKAPSVMKNNVCLIGDAAAILRPHVASGVIKALSDSISFSQAFAKNELAIWQEQQDKALAQQVGLSQRMGRGLVTETPNWETMNDVLMSEWWAAIVAGTTWHHTASVAIAKPLAYQFTQERQTPTTLNEAGSSEPLKNSLHNNIDPAPKVTFN